MTTTITVRYSEYTHVGRGNQVLQILEVPGGPVYYRLADADRTRQSWHSGTTSVRDDLIAKFVTEITVTRVDRETFPVNIASDEEFNVDEPLPNTVKRALSRFIGDRNIYESQNIPKGATHKASAERAHQVADLLKEAQRIAHELEVKLAQANEILTVDEKAHRLPWHHENTDDSLGAVRVIKRHLSSLYVEWDRVAQARKN